MSALPPSNELIKLVALLAAAVVAVPLFRRLGFSSVLGYLAGGLAGVDAAEAARTAEEVRRLDGERFDLELAAGDIRAGIPLLVGNTAPGTPTPLTAPRRESQVLNPSSPVNLEDP